MHSHQLFGRRKQNRPPPPPHTLHQEQSAKETNTIYSYHPRGRDNVIQNFLCDSGLTKLSKAVHNLTDEVTPDHRQKREQHCTFCNQKVTHQKKTKGVKRREKVIGLIMNV